MKRALSPLLVLLLGALACAGCEEASAQSTGAATNGASRGSTYATRAFGCTAAPTVTNVSPSSGTEAGGTSITVTGTCLTGATVTVGGNACTSVVVATPLSLTCTTPATTAALSSTAASNAVTVAVTTGFGSGSLSSAYTYTSEFARIAGTDYFAEYRFNDPALSVTGGVIDSVVSYGSTATLSAALTTRPTYEATGWNGGPSGLGDGSNDCLKNNSVAGLSSGTRPYMFIALQRVSATGKVFMSLISLTGNNESTLKDSGTSWQQSRHDSSGGSSNSTGNPFDTNKNLLEHGFTASGTNSLVVNGSGTNNSRTGTVNETMAQLALFADAGGNTNSNIRIAWALVLKNEPSSGNATAIRNAAKSAMWIGYTSSSLGLP